jgi:hypothetical protein
MQEQKIIDKIERLRRALGNTGGVLKGSISPVRLGERKKTAGQRIAYLLTYKGSGNKTKSVYVSKERVPEVKRMIQNYKAAKQAIETMVELNIELFKIPRI